MAAISVHVIDDELICLCHFKPHTVCVCVCVCVCVTVAGIHYEMVTCKSDDKPELMKLICNQRLIQLSPFAVRE